MLRQPGGFLRTAGPWMAAFAALFAVGEAVSLALPTPATGAALGLTALLLVVAGYNAFAVAWHRRTLLGEARPFGDNLRFGRLEARYLLYSMICVLVLGIPAAAIGFVTTAFIALLATLTGVEQLSLGAAAVLVLLVIVAYAGAARLMLALPSVAVDEGVPYIARAWQRTRGNTLRLLFGMIACSAPVLLLAPVHRRLAELAAAKLPLTLLVDAVFLTANFIALAVYVGFLSTAYEQLAGARRSGARRPER